MRMSNVENSHILGVRHALGDAGLSWSELCKSSDQIVLFGSRSIQRPTADSDWDLLCIGLGRTMRCPPVDLVWIRPALLASREWLTSELATHVARYGTWLWGRDSWSGEVCVSEETARRKFHVVALQLQAAGRCWFALDDSYRAKHLRKIRRNLQRYELLRRRAPVPPSIVLDDHWEQPEDARRVWKLLETIELPSEFGIGNLRDLLFASPFKPRPFT
jgi:hypothetical protein